MQILCHDAQSGVAERHRNCGEIRSDIPPRQHPRGECVSQIVEHETHADVEARLIEPFSFPMYRRGRRGEGKSPPVTIFRLLWVISGNLLSA